MIYVGRWSDDEGSGKIIFARVSGNMFEVLAQTRHTNQSQIQSDIFLPVFNFLHFNRKISIRLLMLPFENHWTESYRRKAATPFPNWFNLNVCHHRTQAHECNMLKVQQRLHQRMRLRMTWHRGWTIHRHWAAVPCQLASLMIQCIFRTHSLHNLNLKMLFFNLIDLKVMKIGCTSKRQWVSRAH